MRTKISRTIPKPSLGRLSRVVFIGRPPRGNRVVAFPQRQLFDKWAIALTFYILVFQACARSSEISDIRQKQPQVVRAIAKQKRRLFLLNICCECLAARGESENLNIKSQ
jgi:hypothetical protein